MFCPNCGAPTEENALFCGECGIHIDNIADSIAQNEWKQPYESGAYNSDARLKEYGNPAKRVTKAAGTFINSEILSAKWFIIALVAILSVTAIVIVVILSRPAADTTDNAQSLPISSNSKTDLIDDNEYTLEQEQEQEQERAQEIADKAFAAHQDILAQIISSPNDFFDYDSSFSLGECTYAMSDIDGDGVNELAVNFTACVSASMKTSIWKYDPASGRDVTYATLNEGVSFYKGNYVEARYSHNHSEGYTVWPYDILKYDEDIREYICIASGYSIDREYAGNYFPDERDTDGDGVIYHLDNSEDSEELTEQEYLERRNKYIPDKNLIAVQWLELANNKAFQSVSPQERIKDYSIYSPELFRAGMDGRVTTDTPAHAGINMRALPQSDSDLITTLKEGDGIEIISDYDEQDSGYILVRHNDANEGVSFTGWVLCKYLECRES